MASRNATTTRAATSALVRVRPPVGVDPTALLAVHRLDAGPDYAEINLAANDAPRGILHGTPGYHEDGYMMFDGGVSYLETAIKDRPVGTHIIMCKSLDTGVDAAHQAPFVGNYQGPSTAVPARDAVGANIFQRNSSSISEWVGYHDGISRSGFSFILNIDPAQWLILVLRWNATRRVLTDLVTGKQFINILPVPPAAAMVRDLNNLPYCVGGFPNSTTAGNSAAAEYWNFGRDLSDNELPPYRALMFRRYGHLLNP